MNYLAHNGVEHSSGLENAAHTVATDIIAVVAISLAILGFIIGASLLIKKFAIEEETGKERE